MMQNNNPIMQMLGKTQSQNLASNMNSFLKMFKTIQNPQVMLQQMMASQDPRLSQVMNFIHQNGNDPEKLARNLLAQRGIDADELLKQLK